MMNKDRILLFIPMYNCEKQIVRVVNQLDSDLCKYLDEIIIVNNRSTDNGEDVVLKCIDESKLNINIKLLRNHENYGLGGSHKVAFDYALKNGFDYIIVLHGDDQGSIGNIKPILTRRLYRKYDAILGARFMPGSKLEGYSKFRTIGNVIYNILFSLICWNRIYDLGSGLNMYKVSKLKTRFYKGFKDDLVFNYCMILAESYFRHRIRFFPIVWREEDQVSNVKMFSQAITVIKLLLSYSINRNKFILTDHRDKYIEEYKADIVQG